MIEKVELQETEYHGRIDRAFLITYGDGNTVLAPTTDPRNRHYQEIEAWYKEQEKKPFDFDFSKATEATE